MTRELLEQVEAAEEVLRRLGFRERCVCHHGALARIEIARAELGSLLSSGLLDKLSDSPQKSASSM